MMARMIPALAACRRHTPVLHVATLGVAMFVLAACRAGSADPAAPDRPGMDSSRVAAGGLVEPVSEERVIIPQISGRLARVSIAEGDVVSAGQLIAEIENADLRADMAAAAAEVDLRQAELDRLRHGARAEEIAEATAGLAAAESAEHLAEAAQRRDQPLLQRKLISQSRWDQSRAELEMATAERQRAAAALRLLQAGARIEDIHAGEARLAAAVASRERASAQFGKSQIRSPIDGVVLKRDLREGETAVALSPVPLARIGDTSQLRVRADIDELDIARVRVGQTVDVRSDAFAGRSFPGKVIHVSQRMGRRNLSSGDPAEKQDAKILEALILLEGHPDLPVGLRVDVFIETTRAPG